MTRPPRMALATSVATAIVVTALELGAFSGRARADEAAPASPSHATGAGWQGLTDGTVAWFAALAMAAGAVALVVDLTLNVHAVRIVPRGLADELESRLRAKRFDDALRLCQEPGTDALLARVVLAALQVRNQSSDPALAALEPPAQQAGQIESARLYCRIDALSAIGTLAPLIGLLGAAQALRSGLHAVGGPGFSAAPADIAAVASRALVIVVVGLLAAIPALGLSAFFRMRLDRLLIEVEARADAVLQLMARTR